MKVLYLPVEELAQAAVYYTVTGELTPAEELDARDFYHSLQMQACAGDTWFELPQEDDEGGKQID